MIKKLISASLLVFIFNFALVGFVGAQSEALKSALEEATDDTQSLSQAVQEIVDFLIIQSEEFKNKLENLRGLEEAQQEERDVYIAFLEESIEYLESLEIPENDDEAVKELLAELKEWREEIYNPMINEIVEFILVYHIKFVLGVAEARFVKINADLDRLVDLDIIEEKPQALLNAAHLSLVGARDLHEQAEFWFSTTTENPDDVSVKELISASIAKIKFAYEKFLEISKLVREALK